MTSRRIKYFIFLQLVVICCAVSLARAENQKVEAVLSAEKTKVISAYAVIFPGGEAMMKSPSEGAETAARIPVSINLEGFDEVRLSFEVDSQKLASDERFIIVYTLADKSLHATSVQRLTDGASMKATKFDGACEASEKAKGWPVLAKLSEEDLKSLNDIRRRKRDLLVERLKEVLTPERTQEFEAIESRFGFSQQEKFTADMPLRQLVWRLGIVDSLKRQP